MSEKLDSLNERIKTLAKESMIYRARCKALMDITKIVNTRLLELVDEFLRMSEEEGKKEQ